MGFKKAPFRVLLGLALGLVGTAWAGGPEEGAPRPACILALEVAGESGHRAFGRALTDLGAFKYGEHYFRYDAAYLTTKGQYYIAYTRAFDVGFKQVAVQGMFLFPADLPFVAESGDWDGPGSLPAVVIRAQDPQAFVHSKCTMGKTEQGVIRFCAGWVAASALTPFELAVPWFFGLKLVLKEVAVKPLLKAMLTEHFQGRGGGLVLSVPDRAAADRIAGILGATKSATGGNH